MGKNGSMLTSVNNQEVGAMRTLRIAAIVVLLSAGHDLGAEECGLVNGSFEADGFISDIRVKDPNGWDVNVPAGKFPGYITDTWPTDGDYNLKLVASWFVTFVAGEEATVSQEVLLDAVDEIIFDLKLETQPSTLWDPNVCTAVALIDDDVVWESDFGQPDIRGEYPDQAFAIDDQYRDGQFHRLALGLRMNAGGMFYEQYISHWDAVECTLRSDDAGPLPGDFNADGFVQADDLMLMTAMWLFDVPADDEYNLSGVDDVDSNGIVNFYDFAVFGNNWRSGLTLEESPE